MTRGKAALAALFLLGACAASQVLHQSPSEPLRQANTPALTGAECNGLAVNCERRFDQVVHACSHNAYATESTGYWLNANQRLDLSAQLQSGIRCLMLDAYAGDTPTQDAAPQSEASDVQLCHGPCWLGSTAHRQATRRVSDFLAENPREVVTLMYEDHLPVKQLARSLERSGLLGYVFVPKVGAPWPTLQEMIATNERLVITVENATDGPDWMLNLWDHARDTTYGESDFGCALSRGHAAAPLFLMNHWVNNWLGLPAEAIAKDSNSHRALSRHVARCQAELGRLPTFIAVDFYHQGRLLDFVRDLNASHAAQSPRLAAF